MKIEKTNLEGVLILEPEFRFKDERGETVCAFEQELFNESMDLSSSYYIFSGTNFSFSKHNFSISHQNVLRGIHVSNCWKTAYCPSGRIYLVVVDCRAKKSTFGKWEAFGIDDDNRKMILIPPMFGLAHLVLSERAVFYYHWSSGFDGDKQIGYHFGSFGIKWPCKTPIVSKRDFNAPFVKATQ